MHLFLYNPLADFVDFEDLERPKKNGKKCFEFDLIFRPLTFASKFQNRQILIFGDDSQFGLVCNYLK